MSSIAETSRSVTEDAKQTFQIPVSSEGTKYSLLLKVNLDHVKKSTAKLVDTNTKLVVQIAENCIFWVGESSDLKGISHKKVKKMVNDAAPYIILQRSPSAQKTFEVCIPIKLEKKEVHFSPVPKEELPNDQVRLLYVKTRDDYSQLFAIHSSSTDRYFDSMHLSRQFTVISPWQNEDTAELIALLTFLTEDHQKRALSVFKDTFPSIQTVAVAIELLIATKIPRYRILAAPLLKAVSETFSDTSVVWQNDLEHLIRIFEHFLPEDQGVFVDRLATANQPTSARNLVENLTEAFKILQRINYRIASQRRLLKAGETPPPTLLDTLTTSAIKTLILAQVNKLGSDLDKLDVPSVTCYLKCLTTLMEIAVALGLEHLPEKNEFSVLHNSLKGFVGKNWWKRFKAHRNIRKTDLGINFLAKYALHLLTLVGSDTSQKYRALCCVFYALRGISGVAAAISIDQPWAAVKGIIDSIPDFKLALNFHDRKLKAFIHLNLLQAAYLGGGPNWLMDFNLFANDLIHNPAGAITHLPMHNKRFFVIGLLELLQMIHQSYKEFPEVGNKAIELIALIKDNNLATSDRSLFRVVSKKMTKKTSRTTTFRDFIVRQATEILNKIQIQNERSQTNIRIGDRLFPHAFNEKFFWSESMRNYLEVLNKQLEPDLSYIVPLKGTSRSHTDKLEDLLRSVLFGKNLIVISGEPGSGKTLFLKMHIQYLLHNYKPGNPLPLYFPLGSFRSSEGNLMSSILKEYGLEKYEAEFKKIPLVVFLDAFDEMVVPQNESPPNIYISNKLGDWPLAKFVYTCRSNMLRAGDEQRYLAPLGAVPELLSVAPFGDPEIDAFFTNYIKVKKAKNEKIRAENKVKKAQGEKEEEEEVVWEEGRYKEYIGKLGLRTIIQTPYYLRQIADYFPTLHTQLSSLAADGVKSDPSQENDQKQEKEFLLDLLVTLNIKREANKTISNQNSVHKPSEYLNYALRVNWLMHICGVQAVPKKVGETEAERAREREDYALEKSQQSLQADAAILRQQRGTAQSHEIEGIEKKLDLCDKELGKIAEDRKKIKVIKEAEAELQKLLYGLDQRYLRKEALIILTPNGMEFAHAILFDYFLEVNRDLERRVKLMTEVDR